MIFFNRVTGWTYFSFDFVELPVSQVMRLTLTQKRYKDVKTQGCVLQFSILKHD